MSKNEDQGRENSADEEKNSLDTSPEREDTVKTAETSADTLDTADLSAPSNTVDSQAAELQTEASQQAEAQENQTQEAKTLEAEEGEAEGQTPVEPLVSSENASQHSLLSHFEPVPEEKIKRAKRSKRMLIVIIVLLLLLLFGAAGAATYYYFNTAETPVTIAQSGVVTQSDDNEIQDRGSTTTIEMPNLVQMFGKTPEEVVKVLGSDYAITKTETAAEGEASTDAEASSATKQVTISYSPEKQSSNVGTSQVQNIYLSLGEAGTTIEVYFASSMGLLDYPVSSFADLVATKSSLVDSLLSAGATVASDFAFTAPTKEEYTVYVDPDASSKKIKKETATFKGSLASEQAPTRFEVTYTYDFGSGGVEDAPGKQPSQRMLYIKLS